MAVVAWLLFGLVGAPLAIVVWDRAGDWTTW